MSVTRGPELPDPTCAKDRGPRSGLVHEPAVLELGAAAGLVRNARDLGLQTLELNLEPSQGSSLFHESRLGPASEVVPEWVAELLA